MSAKNKAKDEASARLLIATRPTRNEQDNDNNDIKKRKRKQRNTK